MWPLARINFYKWQLARINFNMARSTLYGLNLPISKQYLTCLISVRAGVILAGSPTTLVEGVEDTMRRSGLGHRGGGSRMKGKGRGRLEEEKHSSPHDYSPPGVCREKKSFENFIICSWGSTFLIAILKY